MTVPSSQSLISEVKRTGSEFAFIRVLRLELSLRMSSEDFRLLQESLEMIVLSSKIPALPGKKSHVYISEKVGRYKTDEICIRKKSIEFFPNVINQAIDLEHLA